MHRYNRHKTSIFMKILIPLMVVMMIQAILSFGAILVGGTTRIIDENYVNLLRQNVEKRGDSLESMMNQNWSDVDNLVKASDTVFSDILGRNNADVGSFSRDDKLQSAYLEKMAEELLVTLRKNNVTGAFVILNNGTAMPDQTKSQKFMGLCFRDLDPYMNPGDYRDVLLERGSAEIASRLGLAMDSWWRPSYDLAGLEDVENMGFLFKPLDAAYRYPALGDDNLGYWCGPVNLNGGQDATEVVTYSVPLKTEEGVPYGVAGVEITMAQLCQLLPSEEVDASNRGGYMLVNYQGEQPEGEAGYKVAAIAGNMLKTMTREGDRLVARKDSRQDLYTLPYVELYGEPVFASVSELNLYNSNTPFSEEKWAVMGAANHDALFDVSDRLVKNTLAAVAVSLLIGVLAVYIVSNVVSNPLLKLVENLKSKDSSLTFSLKPVGVQEIDELSSTINDLSRKQKEGEWALKQERERYLIALESSTDVIYEYDKTKDTFTIYHFSEKAGKGEIITNVYRDMTLLVQAGAVCHPDDVGDLLNFLNGRVEEQFVVRIHLNRPSEGRDYIWCATRAKAVYDADNKLVRVVGSTRNVTEEKERERLKAQQNRMDKVTNLYNRRSGTEMAKQCLHALPRSESACLCVLDMDRFQSINNQYGLLYSDILLEQAGAAILSNLEETDIGVRFGGDEFLILFSESSAGEARERLKRIREAMAGIYVGELTDESLNFSAGVSRVCDGAEFERICGEAIKALSLAKEQGRGRDIVFGKDMVRARREIVVNSIDSVFYEDNDNLVSFVFNLFEKTSDIKSVVRTLIGRLGRKYGLDRIIVVDTDMDFCTMAVIHQWHREGLSPYSEKVSHFEEKTYRRLFESYKERDSVLLQDILKGDQEDEDLSAYRRLDEKNGLCSVMYEDAKPLGTVFFLSGDEGRGWTEKERDDLQEIVKIMGAYISKSKSTMASKAKGDFLSRMSHEIRTPMNAIIGMTTIARTVDGLPDKASDCLDKIDSSTKYLLSLVNDILDMSRIESGKMTLEKIDFDIDEVIRGIEFMIRPQAEDKRLHFSVENSVSAKRLSGDYMKLNQVLINILGNAVKFTEEGGSVRFEVRQLGETETTAGIRFSVKDTGIGISEENKSRIFKAFEQAEDSTVREYGGTGLGLAISSNLVRMQGGRLELESQVGKGTEFYFTLTYDKAEDSGTGRQERDNSFQGRQTEAAWEKRDRPRDLFAGKRLLLVEDNELNSEIARELLEMVDFQIETAYNGREAVEAFEGHPAFYYDAVLMDIRMPVMDGLEATKCIRTMEKEDSRSVPIIAMTANAFDEDMKKSIESGMNGHMSKPIDIDRLCGILQDVLADGGKGEGQ